MRNNHPARLVFIIALLNLFIGHANAQNLANAPYYSAAYGSQDYPFNGYALFDIDKDGFRDWIIAGSNQLQYFKGIKGDYNSSLTAADALFTNGVADNSVSGNVLYMDADNDGDSDLVFRNYTTSDINKAVYNTVTAKYDVTQMIANANLSGAYLSMAAADMDGDGRQDLVTMGTYSSGGVYLYKQQANGTYSKSTVRATALSSSSAVILLNDIDADGDKDIVVLSDDGKMHLFTNGGAGTFTETTPITTLAASRTYNPTYSNFSIKNINNDGLKDIVAASYSGLWVSVYKANSNGTYTETVLRANNAAGAGGVFTTITDIDGDGDLDIIAGRPNNAAGISYFENISNTSFSAEKILSTYGPYDVLTAGLADDFDGDGKLDFIVSYNAYIALYRSSQLYYTALTTATIYNTLIGGTGTDAVSVVISDPFSANINFNFTAQVLTGVTVTGNNTPGVTITGLAANVETGLKSLAYTGAFRGDQYFDIAITSGGVTRSMRVGVNITNSALTLLPLHFLSVSAERKQQQIAVKWQTSAEVNTAYFDIERSAGGLSFSRLGTAPSANNSIGINNYQWNDPSPLTGINYYRVKSVDIDGNYSYSKVVTANFTGDQTSIHVYPVPAIAEVKITLPPSAKEQILTILDNTGRITERITVAKEAQSVVLAIGSYPSGIYVVQGQDGQQTKFVKL